MRALRHALLFLGLALGFGRTLPAASLPGVFERAGRNYAARSSGRLVEISPLAVRIGATGGRLEWIGARGGALTGENPTGGYSHYLAGNDESRWRTFVPHYSQVSARNLYPKTDVTYYFHGEFLEFDVTLRPGANPAALKFRLPGARVTLGPGGELITESGGQPYVLRSPHVYQTRGGVREPVDCRYALDARGRVGFQLGTFDRRRELTIDPVLEFSTYFGGSGIDQIEAVAVDAAGNVVVAGITNSPNLPGGGVSAAGTMSIFVTRLNSTGTAVLFTTLLGSRSGSSTAFPLESVSSVEIDAEGSIYVTGRTSTSTFPTTSGAWQRNSPGGFITRLDSAGRVVYSTFLGPVTWGMAASRVRARNGIAYLAGTVPAAEFYGTSGAIQRSVAGGSDFFAMAMAADGSAPVFLTAFGGSGSDTLADMDLDAAGNLVLVGTSASPDFPLTADALPYPITGGATPSAVMVRIDPSGARVVSSTCLGASAVNAVAAVPDGGVVVAGASALPADLASGATHSTINFSSLTGKAYFAKFPASSNRPVWTTDFIGAENFQGGISTDQQGNIYWPGYPATASGGALAFSTGNGFSKLSADGSRLLYASPLPGYPNSIEAAVTPAGSLIVAGYTASNMPTTPGVVQPARDPAPSGTLQSPLNASDGFIAAVDLSSFTGANFFAVPPQYGTSVTWRIGEPPPPPVTQTLLLSGDPGPLTVAPSSRLTATYSAMPSPVVSIGVNTAQNTAGTYLESVTVQAGANLNETLTMPVSLVVKPQVSYDMATTQVTIRYRHGQQYAPTTVAVTTHFGGEYFNFDVASSASTWLYGMVNTITGGLVLTINTADPQPGTFDGDLTVSLEGLQNSKQVVHVHCIIDPPATIQISTTQILLHVVKGQPIVPAVAAVTGSVPGVQWGIFVGVSRTWLQVTQTTTSTPGEIHVTVDPATVEVGYWAFSLFVSGEADQRITATIIVDVSSGAALDVTPGSLSYQYMRGGGYIYTGQNVSVVTPSPATVQWTADSWIQPSTGSMKTPGSIGFLFDPTLPEGIYHGKVTITTGSASVTVPVTWTLYDMPHLVFSSTPLAFQWRIGDLPPAAQKLSVTCPTLNADYFQAGATSYPGFLKVDPQYGPTPATLTLTIDTTGLTVGTYTTSLAIQGSYPDSTHYDWIPVTLTVLPNPNAPKAVVAQVTDAASFLSGAVSPGEAVTLFGTGLGPASTTVAQAGSTGVYPQSLGGWTVYFDELPAPILYLSDKQSAVMAPFGIAGRSATKVTVATGGTTSAPLSIPVAAANPSIFTADSSGAGIAAAVNVAADGSIAPHSASTPAARGGVVTFYATGLGVTAPLMQDGSLAKAPLSQVSAPVRVMLGGAAATVLYAGPAPGEIAGIMQINIQIPDAAPAGLLPLLLLAGENPSQPGVTLAIH